MKRILLIIFISLSVTQYTKAQNQALGDVLAGMATTTQSLHAIDSAYMVGLNLLRVADSLKIEKLKLNHMADSLSIPTWTTLSGKPTLSTVATSGSYNDLLNMPYIPAPMQLSATRTLNSAYQISSTKNSWAAYSVLVSVTSTLVGTNTGTVSLQISPTISGTYTIISQAALSIVGVAATNGNTQNLYGFIPAGYYAKIVTASTGANTAVFTYQTGQEITQ